MNSPAWSHRNIDVVHYYATRTIPQKEHTTMERKKIMGVQDVSKKLNKIKEKNYGSLHWTIFALLS